MFIQILCIDRDGDGIWLLLCFIWLLLSFPKSVLLSFNAIKEGTEKEQFQAVSREGALTPVLFTVFSIEGKTGHGSTLAAGGVVQCNQSVRTRNNRQYLMAHIVFVDNESVSLQNPVSNVYYRD